MEQVVALEWAKLFVQLLQTVTWPIFGIVVFWVFRDSITGLIDRLNQITAKGPGFDLSLTQVAKSAAAVGAALGKQSAEQNEPVSESAFIKVAEVFSDNQNKKSNTLSEKVILWVDDRPRNNSSLIQAFRNLGVQVVTVLSTEEAMGLLRDRTFDLIISDMSRPPDHEAGLTLIAKLAESNLKIPVIIFAGHWAAVNKGKEGHIGAEAITNDAGALYETALKILRNR
jgi:CheY-like chemotaxis protein